MRFSYHFNHPSTDERLPPSRLENGFLSQLRPWIIVISRVCWALSFCFLIPSHYKQLERGIKVTIPPHPNKSQQSKTTFGGSVKHNGIRFNMFFTHSFQYPLSLEWDRKMDLRNFDFHFEIFWGSPQDILSLKATDGIFETNGPFVPPL